MVGTCKCGNVAAVLQNKGNFLTRREPIKFSRRTLLYVVSKEVINQRDHG
jgi:hypothetical protein